MHSVSASACCDPLTQPSRAGGRGETDPAARDPQGNAGGSLHYQLRGAALKCFLLPALDSGAPLCGAGSGKLPHLVVAAGDQGRN